LTDCNIACCVFDVDQIDLIRWSRAIKVGFSPKCNQRDHKRYCIETKRNANEGTDRDVGVEAKNDGSETQNESCCEHANSKHSYSSKKWKIDIFCCYKLWPRNDGNQEETNIDEEIDKHIESKIRWKESKNESQEKI